jgi:hypothetical protein
MIAGGEAHSLCILIIKDEWVGLKVEFQLIVY